MLRDSQRVETTSLNHFSLGSGDLLLGLHSADESIAAKVLRSFNVDLVQIRQEILKKLASKSAGGGRAASGD